MQDNADVYQKYVKTFCNNTHFTLFKFCGPHTKPHGVRGLSKNYHMQFYPKLVHGICTIRNIPCACAECTYMLEKTWIDGFPPQQKP